MPAQVTVPIFIPFAGCPHRCSFCDQKAIAVTSESPTPETVKSLLKEASKVVFGRKRPSAQRAQIAFFGGTFTAIEPELMTSLLETADSFIGEGQFDSIRISTRPDAISPSILALLAKHHVTTVELGVQSMDDQVLAANGRGHTAADVTTAVSLLKSHGFEIGLQMMTGLFQSTPKADAQTAQTLIALCPNFLRVYPTVVLAGTELAALWQQGLYIPPTLEDTVALCADIKQAADKAGIPIIRMGLHSELAKDKPPLAGPFHPAFGELVMAKIMLDRMRRLLQGKPHGTYTIAVAANRISAAVGHRKSNLQALSKEGYQVKIIPNAGLSDDRAEIEEQ